MFRVPSRKKSFSEIYHRPLNIPVYNSNTIYTFRREEHYVESPIFSVNEWVHIARILCISLLYLHIAERNQESSPQHELPRTPMRISPSVTTPARSSTNVLGRQGSSDTPTGRGNGQYRSYQTNILPGAQFLEEGKYFL